MEKLKTILWLAPFTALSIAIAYIQGYWGLFRVHAFPYLSVQELITYSAVPFFGVILSSSLGGLSVVIADLFPSKSDATNAGPHSFFVYELWGISILMFAAALVMMYLGSYLVWFVMPFCFFAAFCLVIWHSDSLRAVFRRNLLLWYSIILLLVCLGMSFGYGRIQAETIQRQAGPNATLTFDSGTESVRLLGKLGQHYFYLDGFDRLVSRPEQSVKSVEYLKMHIPSNCKALCLD